jgi:hypothetical protein
MAMIEVALSLDLNTADCTPEARVWLDLDPEQGLGSEVEVPLWPRGRNEWRGLFSVDEARCDEFGYRVGLFAHAEAEWSLSFRRCNVDSELLTDSDRLTTPKAWLVGSCSVSEREKYSAPLPAKRLERRGPNLVLLPGGA